MPQHYARIAFTDEVKETQQANGSRRAMQRFEEADFANDALGPAEEQFIAERDGFYLATASSSGWPYVQYRGGPRIRARHRRNHTRLGRTARKPAVHQPRQPHHGQAGLCVPHGLRPPAAPENLRQHPTPRSGPSPRTPRPDHALNPTHPAPATRAAARPRLRLELPTAHHPRYTAAELQETLLPVREELQRLRTENDRLRSELARRPTEAT